MNSTAPGDGRKINSCSADHPKNRDTPYELKGHIPDRPPNHYKTHPVKNDIRPSKINTLRKSEYLIRSTVKESPSLSVSI